jgi:hypothetical protein
MATLTAREPHPTYIREMMERLGIEPSGGVVPRLALSYATAFHRCEACKSKQACRDWLDSLPGSAEFAPRFCSNADILFELQVNQPSLDRTRSYVEPGYILKKPADIGDLERLEDEINETLLQKANDDVLIADLKRRRSHLRDEIDLLRYKAFAKRRPN